MGEYGWVEPPNVLRDICVDIMEAHYILQCTEADNTSQGAVYCERTATVALNEQ